MLPKKASWQQCKPARERSSNTATLGRESLHIVVPRIELILGIDGRPPVWVNPSHPSHRSVATVITSVYGTSGLECYAPQSARDICSYSIVPVDAYDSPTYTSVSSA